MVVHPRISSCLGKMFQLALYNANTVMNKDTFQILSLRILLIVSVSEAEDVVEVHTVAEDLELDCYMPTLVFIITLME